MSPLPICQPPPPESLRADTDAPVNSPPPQPHAPELSPEEYRLLLEDLTDVVWVIDPRRWRFRYVSPSVFRLRGFTAAEVMARNVAEAFTQESFIELAQALVSRLPLQPWNSPGAIRFVDELGQPRRDGSVVWTETSSQFRLNQRTGWPELVGVARELKQRRTPAKPTSPASPTPAPLPELITLCSACRNVLDDQGQTHALELYLTTHTPMRFSHGLCLACAAKLYPEFFPALAASVSGELAGKLSAGQPLPPDKAA